MTFRIEAAEKVVEGSQITSGNNLEVVERKTRKAAFNAAEKLLKRKDIYSVWVTQFSDEDDDPVGAWFKYEDDASFKAHGGW